MEVIYQRICILFEDYNYLKKISFIKLLITLYSIYLPVYKFNGWLPWHLQISKRNKSSSQNRVDKDFSPRFYLGDQQVSYH